MLKIKIAAVSIVLLFLLPGCEFFKSTNNKKSLGVGVDQSGQAIFFGLTDLHNASYENLTVNGLAKLKKVSVSQNLTVNGNLSASDSTIGAMHVNGLVDLNKTTVSGVSKINGLLRAQSSTLNQIVISTEKAFLSDSVTKTITVKKTKEFVEQLIELNNTKVDGDILFESGKGKVVLKGSSGITGKIEGGVSVKK